MFTVIIVVSLLKTMCIPSVILIGCCVSELHDNICPYRNVWPEAVYHCFTRTTLYLTCLFHGRYAVNKVSCLNSVQFLRYES